MLCIHDIFNFNSLTLDMQQESGYVDSFDTGFVETLHISITIKVLNKLGRPSHFIVCNGIIKQIVH
jgi:hypothetical protein